jgi:hypothetical protein
LWEWAIASHGKVTRPFMAQLQRLILTIILLDECYTLKQPTDNRPSETIILFVHKISSK